MPAPKEQRPRKLSGKRTARGMALWKAALGRAFAGSKLTEGEKRSELYWRAGEISQVPTTEEAQLEPALGQRRSTVVTRGIRDP